MADLLNLGCNCCNNCDLRCDPVDDPETAVVENYDTEDRYASITIDSTSTLPLINSIKGTYAIGPEPWYRMKDIPPGVAHSSNYINNPGGAVIGHGDAPLPNQLSYCLEHTYFKRTGTYNFQMLHRVKQDFSQIQIILKSTNLHPTFGSGGVENLRIVSFWGTVYHSLVYALTSDGYHLPVTMYYPFDGSSGFTIPENRRADVFNQNPNVSPPTTLWFNGIPGGVGGQWIGQGVLSKAAMKFQRLFINRVPQPRQLEICVAREISLARFASAVDPDWRFHGEQHAGERSDGSWVPLEFDSGLPGWRRVAGDGSGLRTAKFFAPGGTGQVTYSLAEVVAAAQLVEDNLDDMLNLSTDWSTWPQAGTNGLPSTIFYSREQSQTQFMPWKTQIAYEQCEDIEGEHELLCHLSTTQNQSPFNDMRVSVPSQYPTYDYEEDTYGSFSRTGFPPQTTISHPHRSTNSQSTNLADRMPPLKVTINRA